VVRLHDGQAEILGEPEGIDWLGGIDFDDAVLAYVDQTTGGAVSALKLTDERQAELMARLRQECTLAKEALSTDEEVTIRITLPTGNIRVALSRTLFEERIGPALTSTIAASHRVLHSAGISPAELSAVLLVGGSSRIPLISRLLASALGRPIVVDTHAKHAVALGAAMIASGDPTGTAASGPTRERKPLTGRSAPDPPTPRIPGRGRSGRCRPGGRAVGAGYPPHPDRRRRTGRQPTRAACGHL